jgi:two-component system response regulator HydG
MTIRKTPTVLVVEDDVENRAAIVKVLEAADYRVLETDNGQQALDLINEGNVDILVTDLRLPIMDGGELLKRAKAVEQDIEVIMITGHGTVEIAVEAIKEGAYDFITKPVKKAQLLRAVDKAAEKQYLSRENRDLRQQLSQAGARRVVYASSESPGG